MEELLLTSRAEQQATITPYLDGCMSNATTSTNPEVFTQHVPLALPEKYDGSHSKCKSGICTTFCQFPIRTYTYIDKICQVLMLITGQALSGMNDTFDTLLLDLNYVNFEQEFHEVFYGMLQHIFSVSSVTPHLLLPGRLLFTLLQRFTVAH